MAHISISFAGFVHSPDLILAGKNQYVRTLRQIIMKNVPESTNSGCLRISLFGEYGGRFVNKEIVTKIGRSNVDDGVVCATYYVSKEMYMLPPKSFMFEYAKLIHATFMKMLAYMQKMGRESYTEKLNELVDSSMNEYLSLKLPIAMSEYEEMDYKVHRGEISPVDALPPDKFENHRSSVSYDIAMELLEKRFDNTRPSRILKMRIVGE